MMDAKKTWSAESVRLQDAKSDKSDRSPNHHIPQDDREQVFGFISFDLVPADEPGGGHDREIGQDGEADDDPGHEPGDVEGPGRRPLAEDLAAREEGEADEQPQGGTDETNDAGHGR